jgi:hypothetical protein
VVHAERCDREIVPRMIYAVALWPAIQVRLYACELAPFASDALVGIEPVIESIDLSNRCELCGDEITAEGVQCSIGCPADARSLHHPFNRSGGA